MLRNAPDVIEVIGDPAIIDSEGIPEYGDAPSYTTHGIFSILDVQEQALWTGQRVIASARLPLGSSPIAPGNRVKVNGLTYVVVTTGTGRVCVRAMLRRSE